MLYQLSYEALLENAEVKFFCGLVSHVQKRFPYSYVLATLVVLNPANTPAKSFIFHGEDEIELHATTCINFDVDSADVGSEWFNDTMFRRLIKLNKYSIEVICSTFELLFIMFMSINFAESRCWER